MVLVSLPDSSWIDEVGPMPGIELVPWDVHAVPERSGEVEVVVPPYIDPDLRLDLLGALPRLRAIQLLTAGYEQVAAHVPDGVLLCNAAGVHDASTSELTLSLILASLRGVPELVAAQRASTWLPTRLWPALADKRVLVVGYGHVGKAIVRRLLPFEVEVTAVASRPRAGDDLVEAVHGIDELPDLLPHHDVVVLIVPLTEATSGLADADFLAAMPDGALLVNVARGKVVDTDALLAETSTGRLRAALDVTDPEPLPEGHPLWTVPGLLLTPHIAGSAPGATERSFDVARAQLHRFLAGEPLANVVGDY